MGGLERPQGPDRRIDKAALAHSDPNRIRDKNRRGFIAKQPCHHLWRQPSDAHHLRDAQPRGAWQVKSEWNPVFLEPIRDDIGEQIQKNTDVPRGPSVRLCRRARLSNKFFEVSSVKHFRDSKLFYDEAWRALKVECSGLLLVTGQYCVYLFLMN